MPNPPSQGGADPGPHLTARTSRPAPRGPHLPVPGSGKGPQSGTGIEGDEGDEGARR